MSTKWHLRTVGCALILLAGTGLAGCEEISDDPNTATLNNSEPADDDHLDFTPVDDDVTFRGCVDNGENLNGSQLNGNRFNGNRFNGNRFNGSILNSVVRAGATLSDIQFSSGSLLSAFDPVAQTTRVGAQLAGTVFNIGFDPLNTGTDTPAKIRITSVVQSSLQSDVYFYNVENEVEPNVYEANCLDGANNPTDAIALRKAWDPTTATRVEVADGLTWACRGAALAKAVEWGYRPWVSSAMEDAHEAAVRMIRADYCGDGVTHTTNGNPIDVSDKWAIQTPDTTWQVEAKWGPNGAVCLNTPRKLQWPRSSIPCAASLPYCTSNGLSNGTPNTSPSQYGGLLMTQAVPNSNPSAY